MSDAAPLLCLTGAADAIGWYYLAEGATHMILKYRGHDPALACTVMRLRKREVQ
jgi:hypothetical protein